MSTIERHLNKRYGYSCQAWLAIDIAERHFAGSHRTWFATSLDPPLNGHSSNPIVLFQQLEKIVWTNDFNNGRVHQLRQSLYDWIFGSKINALDKGLLLAEILAAPMPAFRPQLWRIGLSNIHISRLVSIGQFPDEYLIGDLIPAEFEVMAG
jgi:hypothetical protein